MGTEWTLPNYVSVCPSSGFRKSNPSNIISMGVATMINIENMRKPAKTPRADMPCQPTAVRAHNFKEVTLGYLLEQVQLKASCCLRCKNPCRRQGYPVEVRILEFVAQVVEGDVAETYRILKNTNSFSAACGCVYLQENQCEGKRILSVKGKPVAIDHLERSVTDNAMYDPCVGVSDNDACAVINPDLKAVCIGSDPSFIIVVGHLAVRGVKVTVFEASHEAGGVLIYGIPAPRLPEGVVTAGSDGLRQSNVEFHINWVGGRMASIWQLFDKDYKTVFVGVGADLLQFLDTPGESLTGVPFANGYLTRMNLEYVYNFSNLDMPTYPGRHVMVLGAGNVAMDVTRTALRLGVESPIIIYRHSCAGMSARHEKIERMEEEGVRLFELVRPLYFSASESGIPKSVTL